jgi:hypothetical protein
METPTEVMVHCELMGLKGTRGRLLGVSPQGFYEVNLQFGDKVHRTLLPVGHTVVIAAEAEENPGLVTDVER